MFYLHVRYFENTETGSRKPGTPVKIGPISDRPSAEGLLCTLARRCDFAGATIKDEKEPK